MGITQGAPGGSVMRFSYWLPITRQGTRSKARYLNEWHELGRAATAMLGGRLEIQSARGAGTKVSLSVTDLAKMT